MNYEALLIFGKVVAVIFAVLFGAGVVLTPIVVYQHNGNSLKVITEGKATLGGKYLLVIILFLLSLGFLIGTCGV